MASSNHINYWNYLENVTANRNKEYENTRHNTETEGIGMYSAQSQNLVNVANVEKIGADTKVALANIGKIQQDIAASKANVFNQTRSLDDVDQRYAFDVAKYLQDYVLNERDVKSREINAKALVDRLALDWEKHLDAMDIDVRDNLMRQKDQNIQLIIAGDKNAVELIKANNDALKTVLGSIGSNKAKKP